MTLHTARLVLEGQVQDTRFLASLSKELSRGAAAVRRWGPGLEVRVAVGQARSAAQAVGRARAAVDRAGRASGCAVRVVSAGPDDAGQALAPGIRELPPLPTPPGPGGPSGAVPPDRAPCAACAREARQPGRRHHYLRTECLDCGPRFAAALGLPLGRSSFGLAAFDPCDACRKESERPGSRRFAFSRVSCAHCGPTLTLLHPDGPPTMRDPLGAAAKLLRGGRPVAVCTPYGGLLLATPDAVGALRVSIGEEFQPLTLVVPTLAAARQVAGLTATEASALGAPDAPELLVLPKGRGAKLLPDASPVEPRLRVRLPDSIVLAELTAAVGAVLSCGASRGGAIWPTGPRDAAALRAVPWLWDGVASDTPLPPAQGYFLGRKHVLAAHGRGSLPATAPLTHQATVLAAGGGRELFGAVGHDGVAHLTGSAGAAQRTDAAARLKTLLSHAAALSPSAHAPRLDAVASAAAEGSPSRFMMEEAADAAGVVFVPVTPLRARVVASQAGTARAPPVLVLDVEEPAGADERALRTHRTGGELVDPAGPKVLGGVAPFEVVESPGGRVDLVAPLASLFARAGTPLGASPQEDEPILKVLRGRAETSTSAVALVDGVAAALGLVPRRAPPLSGLMELSKHLDRPGTSRRFRMEAPLVRARGSRQVDALGLLTEFAKERQAALRRAGRPLGIETRSALGASFLRALIDGVAASCGAARARRVMVTGAFMGSPPAAGALWAALGRRGIDVVLPAHGPVLDGALAYGACEWAGSILT